MKRVSLLAIPLLLFAMIVGCSSASESAVSAEDIASIKSDLSAIKSDIADLKSASNVAALQEDLSEIAKKSDELQNLFLKLPDGSAQFATATPVPIIDYNEFGFSIPFPATVEPVASGIGGGEASE